MKSQNSLLRAVLELNPVGTTLGRNLGGKISLGDVETLEGGSNRKDLEFMRDG